MNISDIACFMLLFQMAYMVVALPRQPRVSYLNERRLIYNGGTAASLSIKSKIFEGYMRFPRLHRAALLVKLWLGDYRKVP